MWNRKKEEEYQPKPRPSTPPAPATTAKSNELIKEGIPMSTMPVRPVDHDTNRSSAVIGKSVMVKGQIISREDLTIDGEVEGTVELQEHRLTVGPNGKVSAAVKAREIVVLGAINGNVEATDKIDIRKDAKLVGDIKTARIVIEDGAYFKGSIDIVRPEVKHPQQSRPAQASSTTPAAPAVSGR